MATSPGYKRYFLTLTESKFVEFQAMLKEFGASPKMASVLIDEFVKGMVDTIGPVVRRSKETGKELTMVDFFALVANEMKAAQDDQLKL